MILLIILPTAGFLKMKTGEPTQLVCEIIFYIVKVTNTHYKRWNPNSFPFCIRLNRDPKVLGKMIDKFTGESSFYFDSAHTNTLN